MRAQIKKRQRNRRIVILSAVVIVAALVVVGAYLLSNLGGPTSNLVGQQVSSSVYHAIYAASQSGYGNVNQTLMKRMEPSTGGSYTSGGKPIILYVGADYCPYCAFQRWPLVMALMRFGNFSSLDYMLSSPTDVYANSPTFTFYGSKYTSNYIIFQGYELQDRSENTLQTLPSNYSSVFQHFGGAYPFIDFANQYVVSGSFYFPDQMTGKNWTQIAQSLSSDTVVSNQIVSSANAITAAICKVTSNAPSSVCGNPSVSGLTTLLTAYHPSPGVSTGTATQLAAQATGNRSQYLVTSWGADYFLSRRLD